MTSQTIADSKLRVLSLAVVVSGVIILGSIGVVRYSNRGRQITPAITNAAQTLTAIPDSLIARVSDAERFVRRRDEFARRLIEGSLPVDSVRAFYQTYALWMRDGRWTSADVDSLASFLDLTPSP